MKPVLVCVKWRDIIASADWTKAEELDPPVFETWGWLVYKDKDTVKVASTRDEKGSWFGVHAFPTGCIIGIEKL